MRVTLIEPGAVATELVGPQSPEVIEQMVRKRFADTTPLEAQDIADASALRDRSPRT